MERITWIEPQRLALAASPTALEQLYALHAYGVRALLELGPAPLWHASNDPQALLARLDIAPFHLALPRMAAPTLEQAASLLRISAACRHEARPLLICSPGTQRAGLALWVLWLAQGIPPSQVRARLRQIYPRALRITLPQRRLLRQLAQALPNGPDS